MNLHAIVPDQVELVLAWLRHSWRTYDWMHNEYGYHYRTGGQNEWDWHSIDDETTEMNLIEAQEWDAMGRPARAR